MFFKHLLLIVLPCLFIFCTHNRDNPYDPGNKDYAELLAPANLSAVSSNPHSIKLTWADNNNREEGYVITKGQDSASLSIHAVLDPGAESYIDNACSSYTKYYYKLGVFDLLLDTVYADSCISIRTLYTTPLEMETSTALTGPDHFNITRLSLTSVELSWYCADTAISGHVVKRGAGADSISYYATVALPGESYTDTLSSDSVYYYSVCFFDTMGISGFVFDSITPMLMPNNLYLYLVANENIRVAWSGNGSTTDSIIIERKVNASGAWQDYARLGRGSISFLDTAIASFTTYYYRVYAFSGKVKTDYSNIDSITVKMVRLPVVDSNTILYLHFDEQDGDSLFDSSENHHHGYINTCSRVAGKYGNALNCENDGFAYIGDSIVFSDSSLMVDFWIRPNNYLSNGTDSLGIIEAKEGPFNFVYYDGKLYGELVAIDDKRYSVSANYSFLPNKWTHIVLSYSNNIYKLFIDDAIRALQANDFPLKLSTDTLFIGKTTFLGENCYFQGKIDELRIKYGPEDFFK